MTEAKQLIATGFGDRDTGGGAFVLREHGFERIDWLASTGIAVSSDGLRLARLLRDAGEPGSAGELLLYDSRGVTVYRRIAELEDPHDIVWHEGGLVLASPARNAILWLDDDGRPRRRWVAPGEGDAHHLNCLAVIDGRLLACAFGRFTGHRAWSVLGAAEGAGFVFDVASGREILGGLTCPHHPRRLDGRWLVCDSHGHALVEIHDDGRRRRVELGGWTRGIAHDERSVYVGLSAQREAYGSSGEDSMASVVVLDRATLEETARLSLPCREVYDLAFAPTSLVAGLEAGFRTNSLRVAEQDQYSLFRTAGVEPARLWAIADPLRPEDCAVEVTLELMGPLALGGSTRARFRVVNRGGAVLVTAPPHPVSISWRWFSADGVELVEQGPRVPLPRSLPPGALAEGELRIPSPEHEGDYLLRATLVQEHIRWFDDVDAAYGCSQMLRVGEIRDSPRSAAPAG